MSVRRAVRPRVTGTPPSPADDSAAHAAHAAAAYDHHDRAAAAYNHHDRDAAAYDHHDRTTTDADLGRGWNHHGVPGATGSL